MTSSKTEDDSNMVGKPLAFLFEHGKATVHMLLPSAEDHISKTIVASNGFYERELLDALSRDLSDEDFVVDVGANIGNHTVYFAKVCKCRVAAFEPNPLAFGFLEENIRLNRIEGRVTTYPFALGDKMGWLSLAEVPVNNLGGATFRGDADGDVRMMRLDDQKFEWPISLLKVDAEGMDVLVLQGAMDTIRRDRPIIVCEAQSGAEFDRVRALLSANSYSAVGCFNATDTYLFVPSGSADERSRLFLYEASELLRTQQHVRKFESSLRSEERRGG